MPQNKPGVSNTVATPKGRLSMEKGVATDRWFLQVRPGSHPVGGVRLTQAGFENPPRQRIDQTTDLRGLFDDYDWEPEPGGHADQEHTFVPMRIIIRGHYDGASEFRDQPTASGEAEQDNYTTILCWDAL